MNKKLNALETQLEKNDITETSLSLESEEGNNLKITLLSYFPEIETFKGIELISYHPRDNITYYDDTISLVYNQILCDDIGREYGVPDTFESLDFYAKKYLLTEKICILKAYDEILWKYPLPRLPEGCRIHQEFGIGRHFGYDKLTSILDVYFFHDNDIKIKEMYPDLFPDIVDHRDDLIKGYAFTYDVRSLKLIKIKRYLYPDSSDLAKSEI